MAKSEGSWKWLMKDAEGAVTFHPGEWSKKPEAVKALDELVPDDNELEWRLVFDVGVADVEVKHYRRVKISFGGGG